MKLSRATTWLALLSFLAACSTPSLEPPLPAPTSTPVPPPPVTSVTSPPEAPSPTTPPEAPSPTAPHGPEGSEEAILILEPGPGSRLTSPARVAGIADPTFEQTLVVRIVLDEGAELVVQPVTISADIGQRGAFEGDVPFTVSEERNALIQVYDLSARDGGIIHLASVGVILAPDGPQEIMLGAYQPEAIVIDQPTPGDVISGGVVHVEGFGLASFEQTLIIEVRDVEGNLVGSMPIIVDAPDWGVPGTFSADVPYVVAAEGPGRVLVIDPLPVFDGLGHISSVDITLAP